MFGGAPYSRVDGATGGGGEGEGAENMIDFCQQGLDDFVVFFLPPLFRGLSSAQRRRFNGPALFWVGARVVCCFRGERGGEQECWPGRS